MKINTNLIVLLSAGIAACMMYSCGTSTSEPIEPRKMEVLFLGHDSEHHNSYEYMPYLASYVSTKGINLTYTDDMKDLNKSYLSNFDAVMLYANHDEIKSSHENALLDFIKKGGGFLPVHSASYCFRNSDKLVDLMGGQFESHDTATFALDIIDADHEITAGLEPFETWDETYVHTKHSKKQVLMERVEGDHREPYTWIKEYGKGRIFYTALGHDERTWSHQEFLELLHRGILWSIGDAKKDALALLSLPELTYSAAKIPNYEQRDPVPQFQAPLSPEESMKMIQTPPGFKLELFASEPDIINPIAMNWDEHGRLWILETVDYPNEIKVEDGIGRDRIKIVEDTDGDGKADKFTVFAENLSVPTSLVFANGGVIVSQAPHFLFFKDTDGDDVADVREIIIDGWGTFDTHAGPSNLRYGFDNQIWGVLGYSGYEGKVGGEEHNFSQGVYRFTTDASSLEYMSRTSNNTWGLGISEANDIFISTANNTHSGYYGIPDAHSKNVEGLHARGVEKIDGHYLFHPITRNFRQVDVFGGFTAAAGHALYTARSYPEEYWNNVALVCEPTGHLLHKAVLAKEGAGYSESDGWNLLSSADEWVSPVAADVGPDGAVWILDWYNFIIQHNPIPEGFENGAGNAHVNPLRDKQRGRIYKLVHEEAPTYDPITLDPDDADQLVATLSSDNMLWRMHAQRLLVEGAHTSVNERLVNFIKDRSEDAQGLNNPALHSLWTLHGLGLVNEENQDILNVVSEGLTHPAAGVRKGAIQALPISSNTLDVMLDADIFNDDDLVVRLAASNKLWKLPSSELLAETLVTLSNDETYLSDVWLARSVYVASVKHKDIFIKSLVKNDLDILTAKAEEKETKAIDYTDPSINTSEWSDIPVPKWLNHTNIEQLTGFNGIMWYNTTIDLSADQIKYPASWHIGGAYSKDHLYINGQFIESGTGWDVKRNYKIIPGILKPGKNTIAVKIEGGGGIGGKDGDVFLQLGDDKIPMAGTWKYKVEKIISSARSEYADGDGIIDVFLKNYGPYAQSLAKDLESEGAIVDRRVTIKTIKDQMKYDITQIEAVAGEVLEITFVNNDAMQHNLLVIEPGSLRLVGKEGEAFAKAKYAADRNYVPDMKEILHYIPILNPGEEYKLRFRIPDKPGDYPYVCTFPGHWQSMNGVIKVKSKESL